MQDQRKLQSERRSFFHCFKPAARGTSSPGVIVAAVMCFAVASSRAQIPDAFGTLEKIRETKRITLGYQEASVPFSYLDENQKPVGFAIDICLKIVEAAKKHLGMTDVAVDFTPVTSSNRIPLMLNGTLDLLCSATTNNADRQKQVAFTNSHFLSATRFAAKTSQNVKTINDLKGRSVTAVAGSVNMTQLVKVNAERGLSINILPARDQAEGFLMLETDRAEAYVLDDVQLAVAIARSKTPSLYVISAEAFSKPEPYGIMLRKDDASFKALADRATADLYQGPEIAILYRKWLESPTPPKGINYNVPMSPALKKAFVTPSSSPDPDVYNQ